MQKQSEQQKVANQFLIKSNKLPLSLLAEKTQASQLKVLEVETFDDTFGPKSKRKKPKLGCLDLEEMMNMQDN